MFPVPHGFPNGGTTPLVGLQDWHGPRLLNMMVNEGKAPSSSNVEAADEAVETTLAGFGTPTAEAV